MAKTAAQRQAAHRARRQLRRLDVCMSYPARAALERLAADDGCTLRAAVEAALLDEDARRAEALGFLERWEYLQGAHRGRAGRKV